MSVPWYLMAKGKGGGGYKAASGPIVSVNDALAAPLRSLRMDIDPVQAGSGDPSPDNVRPISGWSAVNVWVKPAYDPTANPTATIQLGDTVYGGTLDVLGGVLTVDRAMAYAKKVHFPNKATGTVMDYRNCSGFPPTASMVDWNLARQQQMSNMAKIANPNTEDAYGSYVAVVLTLGSDPSIGTLRISEDLYQSMTDDDVIEIVYKLLNPLTIPLTATEISTLQGQNVVWADCGEVTLEYLSSGGANPDLMKLAVAFMGRE